jgi:hypothetical protein
VTGVVLTIPEDPDGLPGWLERQLVGPDLDRLVAELTVVHGRPPSRASLAAVLAGHRERVLAAGLGELPRPALCQLLRQPDLLPELQHMVLSEGGPYWDGIRDDPAESGAAERVTKRVMRAVAAESRPPRVPGRRSAWVGYAATALATAALVLAAVYLGGPPPGVAPRASAVWGFARVKELPRNAGDAAVLSRLADLAQEWANQRPTDADGLARRLMEFRLGCSVLLLDDDLPLSAPQQKWLRLRCGDWAAALDALLRRLDETRDVAGVRAAADATVAGIARELRDRAAAARTS